MSAMSKVLKQNIMNKNNICDDVANVINEYGKDYKFSQRPYFKELLMFFHNYQYDEKYSSFMDCDMDYEFDMDGIKYNYFVFYNYPYKITYEV